MPTPSRDPLRLLHSVFLTFCLITAARAEYTPVYTAYLADTAAGREPLLPDYSYAGYERGERPIPFVKGPIFDVTEYGALPNSTKPAYKAIQKAINACEKAGGGVVWFPKGVYQLNPRGSGADAPRLRITQSGVVLRGEGEGMDGSVLYMEDEIQPLDPKKMWTGQPILAVAPADIPKPILVGEVVGAVAMNQRRIPVKLGHTIKPGDRVALTNTVSGSDAGPLNQRIEPHSWLPAWTGGINLQEKHEIECVGLDFVVLKEALLTPIKSDQRWTVNKVFFINNIGIEHLRFRGNWHGDFVHHQDWRADSAWRAFTFTRVENSWARDCVFEDMNWPVQILHSRQCTTENLTFTGTPGHFGMQCTSTTNILNLKPRDEAGHWHGPSLQNGSCGTVYHQALWRRDGSFDSHAGSSYANLFECGRGGMMLDACGGSFAAYPHHLHAAVVWNHEQTADTKEAIDFWAETIRPGSKTFMQPILVGITGTPLDFRHVFLMEGTGRSVAPLSLWLAQLEKRLDFIPAHFKKY